MSEALASSRAAPKTNLKGGSERECSPRSGVVAAILSACGEGTSLSDKPRNAALYSQFGTSSGFRQSARFARLSGAPATAPAPEPSPTPEDAAAIAYAEGFAAGAAEAQAQAAEHARVEAQARERLGLSFAKLDQKLAEELRLKLRETVAALCETAIAPLSLDEEALMRRIERAVGMLQRADDERIIRLHPDDLSEVADRIAADWNVIPDPILERGAVLVQSASGGVEDGPAVWRRAIAEALQQC